MGLVWKIALFAVAFGITSRLINTSQKFDASVVSGKRVLITGASSGIGEQLAYQYAKNGANVYITARREHLLEKVIQNCKRIGAKSAKFGYLAADMSDLKQIEQLVTSSVEHLGGLDVVIINHALMVYCNSPEDLQEQMKILQDCLKVNVEAPAFVAGLALPHLFKSQGYLGVVNSASGKVAMKYWRPYSTSKFALEGYFNSLRDELKRTNVSVTNVVLGAIETAHAREILDNAAKHMKFYVGKARTMSPEDTAAFILEGVANREKEIYYPTYLGFLVFFREIFTRYDLLSLFRVT